MLRLRDLVRRNRSVNFDQFIARRDDGDFWRLLTPGEYEIIAMAEGYKPKAQLVQVNDPNHKEAPIVTFEMERDLSTRMEPLKMMEGDEYNMDGGNQMGEFNEDELNFLEQYPELFNIDGAFDRACAERHHAAPDILL